MQGWKHRHGVAVVGRAMRQLANAFVRVRYSIRSDIREWLDGFGAFIAITLFFCLIAAAHDGIVNRNRDFDAQRWWYPIYKTIMM
jgi:hypothetical protein